MLGKMVKYIIIKQPSKLGPCRLEEKSPKNSSQKCEDSSLQVQKCMEKIIFGIFLFNLCHNTQTRTGILFIF